MAEEEQLSIRDLAVDKNNLFREELITDLKVATLRRMTPIKSDGTDDAARETLYMGQTQIMSQAGPLPVQCKIDAASLEDAIDQFPQAIQDAVERMVEEAREMQRREANRIITPGQQGPGKISLA